MTESTNENYGLKPHVCPVDGCFRSFWTEEGVEHHLDRGNHDPGADDG